MNWAQGDMYTVIVIYMKLTFSIFVQSAIAEVKGQKSDSNFNFNNLLFKHRHNLFDRWLTTLIRGDFWGHFVLS